VEFESIELSHLVNMRETFASELERLAPFVEEGLVEIDDQSIQVTALGWYFVRGIAMVFDRYVQADRTRARFSRII
jgi:oxygen-independent coproporphyrinogen III oxidase